MGSVITILDFFHVLNVLLEPIFHFILESLYFFEKPIFQFILGGLYLPDSLLQSIFQFILGLYLPDSLLQSIFEFVLGSLYLPDSLLQSIFQFILSGLYLPDSLLQFILDGPYFLAKLLFRIVNLKHC